MKNISEPRGPGSNRFAGNLLLARICRGYSIFRLGESQEEVLRPKLNSESGESVFSVRIVKRYWLVPKGTIGIGTVVPPRQGARQHS